MNSIYLIGSIQTVFLSLLIISRRKLRLSDIFLFFFILLMGLRLLNIYFQETGISKSIPKIVRLIEFVYWPLFGPMLFLYIESIISRVRKFKKSYLVHFIPALIVLLVFSGYIYNKRAITFQEYCRQGFIFITAKYIWYFTTHVYFIFCVVTLHKHRRKLNNYFSYRKNIDLQWLLFLTYGFGIYLFTSMSLILTREILSIEIPEFYHHLSWLIMVLYIFCIAFFGYRQKNVFDSEAFEETSDNNGLSTRYHKTGLKPREENEILTRLVGKMENEKLFLDCGLNLRTLSEELDTSPNKLSQVINSKFEKNFFDFINEYRVSEAKERLKDPMFRNEKIMSIAYDCGFNSKSVFFSVFKRSSSVTPSEFRKKNSEGL